MDWLFVPLIAQFLIVNLVLYPQYAQYVYQVGTFSRPTNVIFPYTWASALLLFGFSVGLFYWRYRVDVLRSVLYALGLCFAAASLFEIIYQNVGSGQGIGNQQWEGQGINLSAIVFGFSSLRFWRATRPGLLALILFLAG